MQVRGLTQESGAMNSKSLNDSLRDAYRITWRCALYWAMGVCALAQPVSAQRKSNPAYAPIEDQPGLPRVLLLGDSISIGYTLAVRGELEGIANVHRPAENCSSTKFGLTRLNRWLGDKQWDLIHFNFGLHDLKYVVGDQAALVDTSTEGSHVQVSIEDYERNLDQLVAKLKATDAKLIWCSTTPVPEGAKGRYPADVPKYNAAARRVMKKYDVQVNDLYEFALPKLESIQRPRNVHYTPDGSKTLAIKVAQAIREGLADD